MKFEDRIHDKAASFIVLLEALERILLTRNILTHYLTDMQVLTF